MSQPTLDPSRFVDVDIYSQEIKADPWPWYQRWADSPPFYVLVHGRPNNVVICRHESVRRAFTDFETFSTVPQPGWGADYLDYFNGLPVITELDPPEHNRQRRLMHPAFTPRRIAQVQDGIATLADEMVEHLAARGAFDIVTEFAQPLAHRVLLGSHFQFPEEDWPTFTNLSTQVFATRLPGAPKSSAYIDALDDGHKFCAALIEQHRRGPKGDLIGSMIAAHDDEGAISNEELFTMMLVLFASGHSTLSGTLGLCMLRLCRHRDQLKLLQDDPSLLDSAIEECLRVDSISIYRHRYVMKDVVIDGVPLYRGMIAHLSMAASNYDPSVYPEPNRFDIRRNPKDINSFGYGAHLCIGSKMARAVIRTGIGRLVQRFPNIRLADPNVTVVYGGAPQERAPLNILMRVD